MDHPPIEKEDGDRPLKGEEDDCLPLKNIFLHLTSKLDISILNSSFRYSATWGYISIVQISQGMGPSDVKSNIIIWTGNVDGDPIKIVWTYDEGVVL